MPGDDQLVEVYGLLLDHPVETEVVEDEQVRGWCCGAPHFIPLHSCCKVVFTYPGFL